MQSRFEHSTSIRRIKQSMHNMDIIELTEGQSQTRICFHDDNLNDQSQELFIIEFFSKLQSNCDIKCDKIEQCQDRINQCDGIALCNQHRYKHSKVQSRRIEQSMHNMGIVQQHPKQGCIYNNDEHWYWGYINQVGIKS